MQAVPGQRQLRGCPRLPRSHEWPWREGPIDHYGDLHGERQGRGHSGRAPSVDLVDGARLCDLLRDYGLGVTATPRTVYDVTVQPEFFEGL